MGAVVTRSVPAHAIVYGNPARQHAWACLCGRPLRLRAVRNGHAACPHCGCRELPALQREAVPAADAEWPDVFP
jgi:UDP-2-acetamido-3-amino-2,3-dideoxy-glucuronate N-acetyltransferase